MINFELKQLVSVLQDGKDVQSMSPLVSVAQAVIEKHPDVVSNEMSLSAFNVILSEYHGKSKIPVIAFPTSTDDTDSKNKITSAVEEFITDESNLDTNIASAFRYIADEIIDNITEHADTSVGYISAIWDSISITICIADGGKTVYGSYVDENIEQVISDQTALQAAVTGVSTKNLPGAENRGFGLSTSSDMIVNGLRSSIIILSGRGLLVHDYSRNDYMELPESIYMPGTVVCFNIPIQNKEFCMYNHLGG